MHRLLIYIISTFDGYPNIRPHVLGMGSFLGYEIHSDRVLSRSWICIYHPECPEETNIL